MTTIFDSARSVKSAQSFGRGINPPRSTHFEPSDADRAWAAELFDRLEQARFIEEENRRLEELAAEAEWLDQFNNSILTGHCLNCGDRCEDLTVQGLCDRCDTAATEATIACVNGTHGLGYRTF